MMDGYIGRGRGIATNVPELELIEQVKLRPLLYDKNVKDYRKSGASEQAWSEVANVLQTTVTNCRKRWKSLRDTFIKYYRLDVMNKKGEKKNRKNWVYYKDLSFLIPHVDLYRLDDSVKANEQHQSDSLIYLKEDYLENEEKHIFFTEENHENDEGVTYQIKIAKSEYDEEHICEGIEEDNLLESNYVEERLDDSAMIDLDDQVSVNKVIQKMGDDEHAYMLVEQQNEEAKESEYQNNTKISHIESSSHDNESTSSSHKNVIDPDERYLLSCLPAFKRLTPQKKGLIRMGIERLFYEVEFQNDNEPPKSKKFRNS